MASPASLDHKATSITINTFSKSTWGDHLLLLGMGGHGGSEPVGGAVHFTPKPSVAQSHLVHPE